MGVIASLKFIVLAAATGVGCLLQGAVTIGVLVGAAWLLGGSGSLAFQVFAAIWSIGMVVLMVLYIRWLVLVLGRRVDAGVEHVRGSVGLGAQDEQQPDGDRGLAVAKLDARMPPAPRRRAGSAPTATPEVPLADLSPTEAINRTFDIFAALAMSLAGAAIGAIAGILLLVALGPGARTLGAAILGVALGFVVGAVASVISGFWVIGRAAEVRWLRARLSGAWALYQTGSGGLVAALVANAIARL